MRRRAAVVRPSPHVLSRGNEALSTTRTSRPRRRAARPAAAPAGPAPTTRTSTAVGIAPILRSPASAPDRFDVGGLGGAESPTAFLGKQEWYEHRCLREADPPPGPAGRAGSRDQNPPTRRQAGPRRLRPPPPP